jgi:hypothetical protein
MPAVLLLLLLLLLQQLQRTAHVKARQPDRLLNN